MKAFSFSITLTLFLLGLMTGCTYNLPYWNSKQQTVIQEDVRLQNPHPANAEKVRQFELFDFGTSPQFSFFFDYFKTPTPLTIANISLITTNALYDRLAKAISQPTHEKPILIDVRSNKKKLITIKQAIWLNGVGYAYSNVNNDNRIKERLYDSLQQLTQNNFERPLIFMCANPMCALSYNAAKRAFLLGYQNVFWYRGGVEAWYMAGFPMVRLKIAS